MPLVTDGNVDGGRHMYKDGRTARMNNKADDTTVYSPAGAHPSGPLQLEASCAVAFHMRAAIQSALLAHVLCILSLARLIWLMIERISTPSAFAVPMHPIDLAEMPFVMRLHNYQLLKQPISEMS
jgi:hypothetical protein